MIVDTFGAMRCAYCALHALAPKELRARCREQLTAAAKRYTR
jgi:hypothetical protein